MHGSSAGGAPRRLAPYAIGLLLCGLILAWQLRLWQLDPRVPLAYKNDGLVSAMYVKAVADNGWYLHNPSLGAPAGLDLADFPMADGLHFLLIKLLTLCTKDYALVFNGYFLLTFPLTTLSALLVLRHFGVAAGPAVVAGLLFTFVPYHFFHGPHHLWLAAYFLVPPLVMVALWIYLTPRSQAEPGNEDAGASPCSWRPWPPPPARTTPFLAASCSSWPAWRPHSAFVE